MKAFTTGPFTSERFTSRGFHFYGLLPLERLLPLEGFYLKKGFYERLLPLEAFTYRDIDHHSHTS